MHTLSIDSKAVSIFQTGISGVPVIYLNTYSEEGQQVFEAAQAAGYPPFTLVAISDLDWNHDMAPWDSPAAFKKGTPFTGGADDYLRLLVDEIIPEAEKDLATPPAWRGIAGYSLAGLFALYAGWGACPAPCGFLVSRSTSSPTSQRNRRTASTSPWGTKRPKPAIRF